MNNQTEKKDFSVRFNSFLGKTGICFSILLFPFICGKLFTVGEFVYNESRYLLIASILLLCFSILFLFMKERIRATFSFLFFILLILMFIELVARTSIKLIANSEAKNKLSEQCNWSYPAHTAYVGHPFLQFTGKPSAALKGNEALGDLPPFNNFGFVGHDFNYEKPGDVIRIACIGESTTADGYPAVLETYLNSNRSNKAKHFEVMNFGQAYWTTNHSLVNFLLNVLDFHPDYVVIHHGWNEAKIRNASPEEFRGDYTHAFKSFSPPTVYDRYLIRVSTIYRWLKFRIDKTPSWTSLGTSIQVEHKETSSDFSSLSELKPFERNLENMIDVALLRRIKVILTTLPHSTDTSISMYSSSKSIDQCNAINRKLGEEFKDKIFFVDLDSMITGKHNEIFKDLGHVSDEGRKMKSEAIGKVILNYVEEGSSSFSEHKTLH